MLRSEETKQAIPSISLFISFVVFSLFPPSFSIQTPETALEASLKRAAFFW